MTMIFKTWHSSSCMALASPESNTYLDWTRTIGIMPPEDKHAKHSSHAHRGKIGRTYIVRITVLRTSNVQPCRSQTERRGIGIRGVLSPHRVVTLCVIPQSAPWFPFWFLTSHDWLKLQHTFPFWIRRVYSMYDDPGTENRTCCEAYT